MTILNKIIRKFFYSAILSFLIIVILGRMNIFASNNQGVMPVNNNQTEINQPYISISPDYFYTLEEILYIEGRADVGSVVNIILEKQGEKPVKFSVKTDSSGEWVVAEKTYLNSGNWEVRARQQLGLLFSDWSNPRVIRSVVTGVNFFGFQIKYVVLSVVIIVFLFILSIGLLYFRKKVKQSNMAYMEKIENLKREQIEQQIQNTETMFHNEIAEIRKDLMDELKDMATKAASRPLTPEEIERQDRILAKLADLEKNLEHDINSIQKKY